MKIKKQNNSKNFYKLGVCKLFQTLLDYNLYNEIYHIERSLSMFFVIITQTLISKEMKKGILKIFEIFLRINFKIVFNFWLHPIK